VFHPDDGSKYEAVTIYVITGVITWKTTVCVYNVIILKNMHCHLILLYTFCIMILVKDKILLTKRKLCLQHLLCLVLYLPKYKITTFTAFITFIFQGKYLYLTCATLCEFVKVPPPNFSNDRLHKIFCLFLWVSMEVNKSTLVNKVHEFLKAFSVNHDPYLCRNLTTLEVMVTR
jgi:hypothetical protein